jgi:hypothetical protein
MSATPAQGAYRTPAVERRQSGLHVSPTQLAPQAQPARPVLDRQVRLSVEQARCFLMQAEVRAADADLPAAMFLLGRLTEHAQKLLDVIDATTR